ncbi:MAG: ABC transporter permease [marine benthic group bacterium]|nr:ABC transporter permease [Gemmatimonadota bacterium]MCL7966483.1 ABC transporter permease [Gemmatimonadota bacterium]MCL7969921.1 ABC transporter permease [Gemmatimonadota bacterium]MCL7978100.1 ABC transporter permease [Gemmatimonadota bacterium]
MTSHDLVRRSLSARPSRVVASSAGIAGCVLLVLLLFSVSRGITTGVSSFVGQDGADVWVAPRGSDNLIRNSGLLPSSAATRLATLPGVLRAEPVLRGFVSVSRPRDPGPGLNLLAIGYRAPSGLGGPPLMDRGRSPANPHEVVLDRAAAWRLGVVPTDTVLLNDVPFMVSGVSDRTNLVATQFAFVSESAAPRLGILPGAVSFIVLEIDGDTTPETLARSVSELDSAFVGMSRSRFVANNVREVAAGFRPMQSLLSLVGFLIAALFVGLLVHSAVEDRHREISILLAIGTPAFLAARGILLNVFAMVLAGCLLGSGVALIIARSLRYWIPTLELAPRFADTGFVIPSFLMVGMIAAIVPLLRLRNVDPVDAFRP